MPLAPLTVPSTLPVCDRVILLNRMAADAVGTPPVRAFLRETRARTPRGVLMAVQHWLRYVLDPPGPELYYPVAATLERGAGDCADLALVVVAGCRTLGFKSGAVWISQGNLPRSHVVFELGEGDAAVWGDPSLYGARLGELPYDAMQRLRVQRYDLTGRQ